MGLDAPQSYIVAIVLILVYGFVISLDSSSLTAGTAGSAEPSRRGATLAVHSTLGYAGEFVGPLIVGWSLDASGGMSPELGAGILARRRLQGVILTPAALTLRHAPVADCARYDNLEILSKDSIIFGAEIAYCWDANHYGTAMPILTIRHATTYSYKQPVAFGEHRMMLRPRDDEDQKVLESEIEITPEPIDLAWSRDEFGNHVATARFADRASELQVRSTNRVNYAPAGLLAADVEDFARTHPFAYAAEAEPGLARYLVPMSAHPKVDRWATSLLREDGSADTSQLLVAMTQTIKRTFKHVARHEKGIQNPDMTLKLASGSCRDLAVLMIAALRSLGIAARFVSGYLHLPDEDDESLIGGNTHAWVQACVPGPGWIDFDPSSGMVGNQNLVRVAVAHEPREAIPLQGTWFGTASDHLAMKVAVKVTGAPGAGAALQR